MLQLWERKFQNVRFGLLRVAKKLFYFKMQIRSEWLYLSNPVGWGKVGWKGYYSAVKTIKLFLTNFGKKKFLYLFWSRKNMISVFSKVNIHISENTLYDTFN